MNIRIGAKDFRLGGIISILIPLLIFWVALIPEIPYSATVYFNSYSIGLFVVILLLYYFALRLQGSIGVLAGFGLTMLLLALALSYKWTSGFSDNFLIAGLLPYKDAKNYYLGANLVLQGLPLEKAGQATERPLFPGLLSALLMLTGQNLKVTLAILVQLAGAGLFLSAREVNRSMGAPAGSLYITSMYFYIQPLTGYTVTEVPGFMLGCFAFVLLWRAAGQPNWFDLILGLLTLLVAVSMRAGAFLILPLLVVWVGWLFRRANRFSIRAAAGGFLIILLGFLLVNSIYARFLGIPPGSAFGNFSYALYGQVRGGTGWHSAIEELGTRDPSAVYRAAMEFFLEHPASLFIGFAKAYRDFFMLGDRSIFPFGGYVWQNWLNVLLWLALLILLAWGLLKSSRDVRSNRSALLLAGFAGIFLSIPFLPPIDGGGRFYASTMAFFFMVPALGFSRLTRRPKRHLALDKDLNAGLITARLVSIVLLTLTIVAPVVMYSLGRESAFSTPSCPGSPQPFAVEVHRGSYIDLIQGGTASCGFVPEVCLSDFWKNNIEKSSDDFYQSIFSLAETARVEVRIIPAVDLIEDRFHYFFVPAEELPIDQPDQLVTGCATEIRTENQSIFLIASILSDVE